MDAPSYFAETDVGRLHDRVDRDGFAAPVSAAGSLAGSQFPLSHTREGGTRSASHAYSRLQLVHNSAEALSLRSRMTEHYESAFAAPSRPSDDEILLRNLSSPVITFRRPIDRRVRKAKLSLNHPVVRPRICREHAA